jgi:hypothetical protein
LPSAAAALQPCQALLLLLQGLLQLCDYGWPPLTHFTLVAQHLQAQTTPRPGLSHVYLLRMLVQFK